MKIEALFGDCLERMKEIPDGSVDMVLTDPPYAKTQNHWDSIIPLEMMWAELKRILKPNGAIVLFGQNSFTFKLGLSNEKMFRYTLIWEKTKAGGFLNANRMPLQAHEDILVFYKKLPAYNPQFGSGKPYTKKAITNGDGSNYGKFNRVGKVSVNDGKRHPRSVLTVSNDNHGSLHPTQKPVALMEYLIKTYTNECETVLDFTAGSFTTGVACINTKRAFIGIEKDEAYFKLGVDRMQKHAYDSDKQVELIVKEE
jgi:site-specific DNA-methyltransferase (adenine-specific)